MEGKKTGRSEYANGLMLSLNGTRMFLKISGYSAAEKDGACDVQVRIQNRSVLLFRYRARLISNRELEQLQRSLYLVRRGCAVSDRTFGDGLFTVRFHSLWDELFNEPVMSAMLIISLLGEEQASDNYLGLYFSKRNLQKVYEYLLYVTRAGSAEDGSGKQAEKEWNPKLLYASVFLEGRGTPLIYFCDETLDVQPGCFVEVPFGSENRNRIGQVGATGVFHEGLELPCPVYQIKSVLRRTERPENWEAAAGEN